MRSEILVFKKYDFFVQNTNFWMPKYEFLFFEVGRSDMDLFTWIQKKHKVQNATLQWSK